MKCYMIVYHIFFQFFYNVKCIQKYGISPSKSSSPLSTYPKVLEPLLHNFYFTGLYFVVRHDINDSKNST